MTKKQKTSSTIIWCVLLISCVYWGQNNVSWIENTYRASWYPFLLKTSNSITSNTTIAIGDIVYSLCFIYLLYIVMVFFKNKKKRFNITMQSIKSIGWIYFLFHLQWAMHYHGVSIIQKQAYNTNYTQADLFKFTRKTIYTINDLHAGFTKDKNQQIQSIHTKESLQKIAYRGYKNLAITSLAYPKNARVKNSLYSGVLTYMGYSGYLNPFTLESQINTKIPKIKFPTTLCHEMAHQIGYAKESEANFIGYLACIGHPDTYFKYSGYLLALGYALKELKSVAPLQYKEYLKKIRPGILKDYQEIRMFWQQHQNPLEIFFKKTYQYFLKANKQPTGLKSYSKMLELCIAQQKTLDNTCF